jgi:monoamine oxidase
MFDVDYCIVGGGFAGLATALRLRQAGHSLALLEAPDRLGGRTFTEVRDDGTYIDNGGTWASANLGAAFRELQHMCKSFRSKRRERPRRPRSGTA